MPDRAQVRCLNLACASSRAGGRVLLETQGSLLDVRMGAGRGGERYELTALGIWLMAACPVCGQPRINPDAMIFDGIGQAIERAVTRVTEAVRKTA